jgi:hypothetical protein
MQTAASTTAIHPTHQTRLIHEKEGSHFDIITSLFVLMASITRYSS